MTDRQAALRIAVDGASGAGKTTTARALGERLGQVVLSPDEAADGRTALFDWMDYAGGRHRGQPIQTQVIAVPGHRYELRRAIIELADVVLFVADSTPGGIYESAEAFRDLQSIRATLDPAPSLVVQANKRDADDAHDVDDLRALLEVTDDVAVVETVASTGDGVRQAFVFAVRSGLARLDVMEGTEGTEGAAGRPDLSPEQLEEHLRALGEDGDDPEDQPAPASPTPSAAGAGSEAPTSTPGPRPDEVVGSGGPDAPMEIEIPFEDVVNLEVVADPAPDRSDEAPTGPTGLPQHADPTAVLASSDPAAPRTPEAGSAGRPGPAGGFDHLPPPPPGVSDGDPTEEGARASWWRRRRSTGAGPAR